MPAILDQENEIYEGSFAQEQVGAVLERVKQRLLERSHVPTSTYRLQFNRFFTFKQARDLVEYFHRLGVSDIYASPYFKARAESLHGYDIANPNELNPSIGTEEDLDALLDELHRCGMFHILDTVPNHMGIGEEGNTWWTDVLENGQASIYAPYFDIDWDPINPKLTGKVLLPLLGVQYGTALENKELQVEYLPSEGRFVLHYYGHTFPLAPRSYRDILDLDKDRLLGELGPESEAAHEYQSIITALDHLPGHTETAPERVAERNREKEVIKRRLASLTAAEPRVREQIERNVETFNGVEGDSRSFDRLDALLEGQPYRLSYWRVAGEEINYRRFFDVNELAAVRIDRPDVFDETHRMIMRFLRDGKLNGLRIDHIDGLRDPAAYLHDLQRGYFLQICRKTMDEPAGKLAALNDENRPEFEEALLARFEEERAADPAGILFKPLYVVVEKILGRGESLPSGWATSGTTGYEFTNAVNGLFVDTANQKAFDEIYQSFTGDKVRFTDLVYESKKQIMRVSLASEVNTLTGMLDRISESDRHYRDFTLNSIRNAIREVIACFPVYRTYITPEHTVPDRRDREYIETAVARAKRRNPATDPSIFDFLEDILLLRGCEKCSTEAREARLNFVMKFQQVTGPVIAKGLEDTTFYIYNRLTSLNEVGGEPEYFGISPAAFHRQQADRQRNWPNSILTTGTHDTKRSEDVRARISVLSEMPKEWRAAVRRWARFNRKLKKTVDGQPVPSPNEEYFLYQTLLGVWPFPEKSKVQSPRSKVAPEASDTLDFGLWTLDTLVGRVQEYMSKAMNEAKVNTSWVNPNEAYQSAVSEFIAAILKAGSSNRFLPDFLEFLAKVAHYGAFNSLSQVLLKITSPGVPDIYQGTELWDFSLVDPDNRRPVDYRLRRRLLERVDKIKDAKGVAALVEAKEDGRVKLFVTSRALRYRRENAQLFAQGNYTPLEVAGKQAESVVGMARGYEGREVLVVAPCLTTRLGKSGEPLAAPVGAVWAGARLLLPRAAAGARFRNIFTGEEIEAREYNGGAALALDEVLAVFPVALLERVV